MIEVDKKQCIYCGVCEVLCPSIFHVEVHNVRVEDKNDPLSPRRAGEITVKQGEHVDLDVAIECCPMQCIKKTPTETNAQ